MKEINGIYVKRMSNGAHFMFMTNVLNRAKADAAVQENAAEYYKTFSKALEKEDEALNISQKSFLSDDIAKADEERDMFYIAYRNAVKGFLGMTKTGMTDNAMAKAAKELAQHIKDYRINVRDQLDKETGLLINFIADLEGKFKEQVATLGLTPIVNGLKEANELVRSYTLQRTEERMGNVVGALKAARKATDEAYALLVKMVNALAMVKGEADYADFIDYMNTEITHYKREVLNQGSSSSKDDTDKPSAGDKPSGEGNKPSGGDSGGTAGKPAGGEGDGTVE